MGYFDPTLEKDELLVLEDGVRQEVMSIRRVPAAVLLLINTSGELNPAMKTTAARELAARLVSNLRADDRYGVLQYGGRVDAIQNWTTNREATIQAIRTKLFSTRGSHLAQALRAAEVHFGEVPASNRHLVLITDGVEESADGKEGLTGAVGRLLAANVTVHVISYSQMGRRAIKKSAAPLVRVTGRKPRKTAADIADEIINPTGKPEWRPQVYVAIDTDFQMRRRRGEYVKAMGEAEGWLSSLAAETGGVMLVPGAEEEMLTRCEDVARAADSQYVVAYRPKRPLTSATKGEYRQLDVVARRAGLYLRTRRGYVVSAP